MRRWVRHLERVLRIPTLLKRILTYQLRVASETLLGSFVCTDSRNGYGDQSAYCNITNPIAGSLDVWSKMYLLICTLGCLLLPS